MYKTAFPSILAYLFSIIVENHLINMHGTQMENFITNEILYNGPHRSHEKILKLLIEWGFTPYQQYFSHITTHLREAMIIP